MVYVTRRATTNSPTSRSGWPDARVPGDDCAVVSAHAAGGAVGHESKNIIGHQANAAGNEVEGPHDAGAAFEAVSVVLGTLLAGRQSALMAGKSIPALAVLSCASLFAQ